MARAKLTLSSDRQIAKAILAQGSLSRKELLRRADNALAFYRRKEPIGGRYDYEKANSPFLKKDQKSTSDISSGNARVVGDHIEISITAPAAGFVEEGNKPPEEITSDKPMFVRVKSGSVRKRKGKRGGIKLSLSGGAPVTKIGNRYYLMTKKVRGFDGYRLLEKSVRLAFRR